MLSPLLLLNEDGFSDAWSFWQKACAPVVVEIGFGDGEYLTAIARRHPEKIFIGLEQDAQRITKALKRIQSAASETAMDHLFLTKIDARFFFQRFVPQQAVDTMICLFPCPWPKKKHHKYRLFSKDDLFLINSRLKKCGTVQIVTDYYPYYRWVLEQLPGTGFSYSGKETPARFQTKFERKWQGAGQESFYELNLVKTEHHNVTVVEDVFMKAFVLEGFDKDKFIFEDVTGPVSVLFKEMYFDPEQQKALIHLILAEDHIKQHFWVTVAKTEKGWRVYKTDGQQIFPTKACALALDLVHTAAKKTVA